MMLALLIGGIGAILAGLLAILFGIPVKEFSFGNTLILSGAAGVCTGMILLGLGAVVWELRIIARRLGTVATAETRVRPILPPGISPAAIPAEGEGLLVGGDQAPEPAKMAPPWHDQGAPRERPRPEAPPLEPEGATPAQRQRRNLLFASTSRKERERAQARAAEALPPGQRPPVEAEPPQPTEAPPATFEDAWPKPERRAPELAQRRPARTPSTYPEPSPPERQPPAPPSEAAPAVTVLKSGVVDGMAYSLYSDGSIEAQLPEGTMRFASIDELRAHLDQKS